MTLHQLENESQKAFSSKMDLHTFFVSFIAVLMGLSSLTSEFSSLAQAACCLVAEHYEQLSLSHCSFCTSLVAYFGNLYTV